MDLAVPAVAPSRLESAFLANVSHEMRTPLNGILGMLELVLEDPLPTEQRERLTAALSAARNMQQVVDNLLDLSSLDAGAVVIDDQWVLPATVVHGLVTVTAAKAAAKGLYLTSAIDLPPHREAKLDARRVRQLLLQLVDNAIKFTERGSVRVGVRLAHDDGEHGCLQFSVSDTGRGIANDVLPRLFEPLSGGREHDRTPRTGFGLTIAQRLAAAMGASLTATTQPGLGSTFTLGLNTALRAAASPAETGGASAAVRLTRPSGERLRVLLAEDNRTNQLFAVAALRAVGCEVDVAGDGAEAIDRVQARPYDLVLMDCQMPGVDGFEATRRIRSAGLTVPIVALTANALPGDRERCLEAGMNDFLTKPIKLMELRTMVTAHANATVSADELRALGVDIDDVVERMGGDRDAIGIVCGIFVKDCGRMLDNLAAAERSGQADLLAKAAHALKGAAGNFTSGPPFQLALQVEKLARSGELAAALVAVPTLTASVVRLQQALTRLAATPRG